MNPDRAAWNERQQALRRALASPARQPEALDLFLLQHGAVHSARVSGAAGWSFADEVSAGLSEAAWRAVAPAGGHSIAWLIWHLARIEDVTMNLLAAGSPQVLDQEGWQARLGISLRDTGNALSAEEIGGLSAAVDLAALAAYRDTVARRTRAIAAGLTPRTLTEKVDPARLEQVVVQGAVPASQSGLLAYWGGLTIAGLLLMPPTRHNFLHLNEGLRLKAKLPGR